jgi:hypothetical protein
MLPLLPVMLLVTSAHHHLPSRHAVPYRKTFPEGESTERTPARTLRYGSAQLSQYLPFV